MSEESTIEDAVNGVVKKFGGRHLIFRTNVGKKSLLPRPYALVSAFEGAELFFYGAGQVFITHTKLCEFETWFARVPRGLKSGAELERLLLRLEPELNSFIRYCNEHAIEGTIVVEKGVIEFHWTFGNELEAEKIKDENKSPLDVEFEALAQAFARQKKAAASKAK